MLTATPHKRKRSTRTGLISYPTVSLEEITQTGARLPFITYVSNENEGISKRTVSCSRLNLDVQSISTSSRVCG